MGLRLTIAVITLSAFVATAVADPVVRTTLGTIRGIAKVFDGEKISAYLGVPYAHPPVGDRRFKIPQIKSEPWGEIVAQQLAKTCYQAPDTVFEGFRGSEMWNPPGEITEDCLNMNIWVPERKTGSVIVWIFGGGTMIVTCFEMQDTLGFTGDDCPTEQSGRDDCENGTWSEMDADAMLHDRTDIQPNIDLLARFGFFSGSPSLSVYDGTALAAKTGAIVVNINYRVGPFGFLYFGDHTSAPGNMGLLDQQTALQWIHEHISSFGGNPSEVTLFGESAGGASVTAHLAAPGSYNYFNKIIVNSGSIGHIWASESQARIRSLSKALADGVGCPSSQPAEVVLACMQSIPAEKIQEEAGNLWPKDILSFPFVPIREDVNFFKGNWHDRLSRRDFKKDVSVIIGEVTDEGTFWLPYNFADSGFKFNPGIPADDERNAALLTREQYRDSMKALMTYYKNPSAALAILSKGYRKASHAHSLGERLRDGVAQYVGDFFFSCGVREFADWLSDIITGSVFKYTFTMRSSANPWPKWMGVMHGYEIEYEFGQPLLNSSLYSESTLGSEQAFSDYMLGLIKSFITTGTPDASWPTYNRNERKSLVLGADSPFEQKILTNVRGEFCDLIDKAKAA